MKSQRRTPKNSSVTLYPVGVRKRKSGKFCAEIKHPFNNKMIWLGTFVTADEAYESYKSKKLEFDELVMAKNAKKDQNLKESDQESCSVRLYPIGVRKRKNGKFCAEIKYPFNKKMIWLGTFVTAEEASESYKSKKIEFDELLMARSAKKGQNLEESDQDSCSSEESGQDSLMGVDENTNSSNGVEEKNNPFAKIENESDEELMMGTWVKISEDKEVKFSHKLGVPVVDNYGFLLGDFSVLDDLRVYW